MKAAPTSRIPSVSTSEAQPERPLSGPPSPAIAQRHTDVRPTAPRSDGNKRKQMLLAHGSSAPAISSSHPLSTDGDALADASALSPAAPNQTLALQLQVASRKELNEARAGLHSTLNSNSKSADSVRELHALLRTAIGDAASPIAHRLQGVSAQGVRDLEAHLKNSVHIEEIARLTLIGMEHLDEQFGSPGRVEWLKQKVADVLNTLGDAASPATAISIGSVAVAMLAKNIAWYGAKAIKLDGITPDAATALAGRVAARWAMANGLAAVAEYPLTVVSQKKWRSLGNSMNTWLGVAQAFDMVCALAVLKVAGDSINLRQGLTLAASAIAVMAQTGMLNGVVKRILGRNDDTELMPMAPLPVELRTASGLTGLAGQHPNVIEQGQAALPAGKEARRQANNIRHLMDAFPKAGVEAQKMELKKLSGEMDKLQKMEIAESAHTTFAAYRKELDQLIGHPGTEGAADEARTVDKLIEEMGEIQKDLEERGGKDPKTIAFYAGMAVMYAGGLVAGNIGGAVKSTVLQNLNVRATLNAVASVPAQTFANLGHLLIKDNPLRSALQANAISIGTAIGLTPFEFAPLQWAIAMADMAKLLAGTQPEAPIEIRPEMADIRAYQEVARLVINVGFNVLALGEKLRPQHMAGVALNVSSTVVSSVLGLKEHKAD